MFSFLLLILRYCWARDWTRLALGCALSNGWLGCMVLCKNNAFVCLFKFCYSFCNFEILIGGLLFDQLSLDLQYFDRARQEHLQWRMTIRILLILFWFEILVLRFVEDHLLAGSFLQQFWKRFIDWCIFYGVFQSRVHYLTILLIEFPDHFCMRKDVFSVDPFLDVHFLALAEDEFDNFKDDHYIKK